MSFNSFLGLFFSLFVVVTFWLSPASFRRPFLLLASFVFYAYGDPIYSLLLLAVIVVGYVAAILIDNGYRPRSVLAASICMLLGALATFKYFDFFTHSFSDLLGLFGLQVDIVTLRILLPIGISFYTFQTIGYIVDVYRKDVHAERNFIDFALFISFFPQLVAGPIEISRNLLLQIKQPRPSLDRRDISYGFFMIVQGYMKKVVIADTLAPLVDLLFQQNHLPAPLLLAGVLMFAFQIYGDFSGYTDIARGYSRLLGFHIILNFNHPYFATSPSNFWRRWHISLSKWFTDYVYIPLGGSRSHTASRRISNVFATMGLSGLWHGAHYNFVIWGFYHGALVVVERGLGKLRPLVRLNDWLNNLPGRVCTFVAVLYGWMYFRVEDFQKLLDYNYSLFSDWSGLFEACAILSQGVLVILIALGMDVIENYWLDVSESRIRRERGLVLYLASLIVIIVLLAAGDTTSFIYFRF